MPRAPLVVGFELSNLCNLHCTHCIRGSHQAVIEELDPALFCRVVDEAMAFASSVTVVFTGGEPLVAPFFSQAVRELERRGVPYRVVTNGWLVPRHLALFAQYPPAFVRISLSGASERTHDRQRGRLSFRKALLAAAALMSRGLRAEMSMVVTRDSWSELRNAVALANELGVAEFHFILPQPTPESAIDGSDLSPAEWNDAEAEVRSLAATSAVTIGLDYGTFEPLPRRSCGTMALRQIYVDARGRVPFCCQLSRYGSGADPILGDLTAEPLSAIIERGGGAYRDFAGETQARWERHAWDAADDYPCLSCARSHGKTGFLANFPEHPWAALARTPA
ncbi:MAG: radical SAM protein [Gemmatimonadaceae bacterium]